MARPFHVFYSTLETLWLLASSLVISFLRTPRVSLVVTGTKRRAIEQFEQLMERCATGISNDELTVMVPQ